MLVDDVESYTQFLPWCARQANTGTTIKRLASLHIDFLSVKSHFTTENAKVFPSQMTIKLVDGPFRRFDGTWHFVLGAGACKIGVPVELQVPSAVRKIIGPVFSRIAQL